MRIKKTTYWGQRALQVILLSLFSFFLNTTIFAQSDIELMAKAARAEGLDKNEVFQRTLETYKQEMAGKYLFEEQRIVHLSNDAFSKNVATKGDKQLLVRQIFHALPQHVMNTELNVWQQRMDSISRALASGADFEVLMNRYSDVRSADWMVRLDMIDEMEQVAFSLQQGQASQPFLSPLGIHIIQVIEERLLDKTAFNTAFVQRIKENTYPNKQTVQQIEQLKKTYFFSENQQMVNRLYREGKVSGKLFTLDGKDYTGEQLARFAQTYPMNVRRQYEAFVAKCVLDCETSHLNEHPEYMQSVQALADKLLAQEAYNQHVRVPSHTDEAGLQTYFSSHQKNYHWPTPRFKGAVIHAADKKTAKKVRKILKKLRNI